MIYSIATSIEIETVLLQAVEEFAYLSLEVQNIAEFWSQRSDTVKSMVDGLSDTGLRSFYSVQVCGAS